MTPIAPMARTDRARSLRAGRKAVAEQPSSRVAKWLDGWMAGQQDMAPPFPECKASGLPQMQARAPK